MNCTTCYSLENKKLISFEEIGIGKVINPQKMLLRIIGSKYGFKCVRNSLTNNKILLIPCSFGYKNISELHGYQVVNSGLGICQTEFSNFNQLQIFLLEYQRKFNINFY